MKTKIASSIFVSWEAALTSAWLFEQVHTHLVYLRDSNCKIFSPNQFVAPAATIQAFVNGAIGVCLPSHEKWVQAYSDDNKMSIIWELVLEPSKINTATLNMVNYNFRAHLHCWSSLRMDYYSTRNLFTEAHPTLAFNLFLENFTTSI